MNTKEVNELNLLKEDIQALQESIMHWKLDILRPLTDHEGAPIIKMTDNQLPFIKGVGVLPMRARYCACCALVANSTYRDNGCKSCPIVRNGGVSCNENGPYSIFMANFRELPSVIPGLITIAMKMIDSLQTALDTAQSKLNTMLTEQLDGVNKRIEDTLKMIPKEDTVLKGRRLHLLNGNTRAGYSPNYLDKLCMDGEIPVLAEHRNDNTIALAAWSPEYRLWHYIFFLNQPAQDDNEEPYGLLPHFIPPGCGLQLNAKGQLLIKDKL